MFFLKDEDLKNWIPVTSDLVQKTAMVCSSKQMPYVMEYFELSFENYGVLNCTRGMDAYGRFTRDKTEPSR